MPLMSTMPPTDQPYRGAPVHGRNHQLRRGPHRARHVLGPPHGSGHGRRKYWRDGPRAHRVAKRDGYL